MDYSKTVPKGTHFCRRYTHDGVNPNFSWRDRWSVRPTNYYFIDFGLSRQYRGLKNIAVTGLLGQDRDVPELSLDVPYDPFKVDIYQLGNVILKVVNVSPVSLSRAIYQSSFCRYTRVSSHSLSLDTR